MRIYIYTHTYSHYSSYIKICNISCRHFLDLLSTSLTLTVAEEVTDPSASLQLSSVLPLSCHFNDNLLRATTDFMLFWATLSLLAFVHTPIIQWLSWLYHCAPSIYLIKHNLLIIGQFPRAVHPPSLSRDKGSLAEPFPLLSQQGFLRSIWNQEP